MSLPLPEPLRTERTDPNRSYVFPPHLFLNGAGGPLVAEVKDHPVEQVVNRSRSDLPDHNEQAGREQHPAEHGSDDELHLPVAVFDEAAIAELGDLAPGDRHGRVILLGPEARVLVDVLDRLHPAKHIGAGDVTLALVAEVEPREAVLGVEARANGGRRCLLTGDVTPGHRVRDVHEDATGDFGVPGLDPVLVRVDLLFHFATGAETHRRSGHAGIDHLTVEQVARLRWKLGLEGFDLDPAFFLLTGELALDGVAHTQWHRDELPDGAVSGVDAVEPRLVRAHEVVLRIRGEVLAPGLTRQRIDLSDADLDGHQLGAGERHPQGLALIHRDEHPALLAPRLRNPIGVVGDLPDREGPEARGQGIGLVVIRDAERPLEGDLELTDLKPVALGFGCKCLHASPVLGCHAERSEGVCQKDWQSGGARLLFVNYQLWKAPDLRKHFGSDNSQVFLPKVKGTVAYAQFIAEYNPDLVWDESNNKVTGEVWCEVSDATRRGNLWFDQQKTIPIFMKRSATDTGFYGPVCLCRPAYFADLNQNAPAVRARDAKLKSILPVGHPGYRDIGAFIVLDDKGPA